MDEKDKDNSGKTADKGPPPLPHCETSQVENASIQESSMDISPTLIDLYDTLANNTSDVCTGQDSESKEYLANHKTDNKDLHSTFSFDNKSLPSSNQELQVPSTNEKSDKESTNQHADDKDCRPVSILSTSSETSASSNENQFFSKDASSPEDENKRFENRTIQKDVSNDSISSTEKEKLSGPENIHKNTDVCKEVENIQSSDNKHGHDSKNDQTDTNAVPCPSENIANGVPVILTNQNTSKKAANLDRTTNVKDNQSTPKHKQVTINTDETTAIKEKDPRIRRKSSRINPPVIVNTDTAINGAASPPTTPPMSYKRKMSILDDDTYIFRVVNEIIDTERSYGYVGVILDRPELPISPEHFTTLFGNIEEIYNFNKSLLDELENTDNDPIQVAEYFVKKDKVFKSLYCSYCTSYPTSIAVLTELSKIKEVMDFLEERQSALHHSLPLGSYLLKPVQRILRYRLLFQSIHQHYNKKADGFHIVEKALDTMTEVAEYINDMKRKHEAAVHVQEIQSVLHGWGGTLTSYGELVLEDTFHMVGARAGRYLYLFEKALLIGKRREDGLISVKADILCSNMVLQEMVLKDNLWFGIYPFDNNKVQYIIQSRCMEQKRRWTHQLKRLIIENHPSVVPMHAKQVILDQDRDKHYGSDDSLDLLDRRDHHIKYKDERKSKRHSKKSDPNIRKIRRGSTQLKAMDITLGMKKPEIISPRSSMRQSHHSGHSSSDAKDTQSESDSPNKRKTTSPPQSKEKKIVEKVEAQVEKNITKEEAVKKSGSLTRSDSVKSRSLDCLSSSEERTHATIVKKKHLGGDDASPRAQRLSKKLETTAEINPRDSVGWSEDVLAVFDKFKKEEPVSDTTANTCVEDTMGNTEKNTAVSNSKISEEFKPEMKDTRKLQRSVTDSDMQYREYGTEESSLENKEKNSEHAIIYEEDVSNKNLNEEEKETTPLAKDNIGDSNTDSVAAVTVEGDTLRKDTEKIRPKEEAARVVEAYTVPRRKAANSMGVPSHYRSSTSVLEQHSLTNAIFRMKRSDKIKQFIAERKDSKDSKNEEDIWVKRTDAATTSIESSNTSLVEAPQLSAPSSPVNESIGKKTVIDADLPTPSPPAKETLLSIEEPQTTLLLSEVHSKMYCSSDDIRATSSVTKIPISRSLSDGTDPQNLATETEPSVPLTPEAVEIVDDLKKYMEANSKHSNKSIPAFPAAGSSPTVNSTDSTSTESLSGSIKHMLHNFGLRITGQKTPSSSPVQSPNPSPRSSQYLENSSSDETKSSSSAKETPPETPEREKKSPMNVYSFARSYSRKFKNKASKQFVKKRSTSDSTPNITNTYEKQLVDLLGGDNAPGGTTIGARYARQGGSLNYNLRHVYSESLNTVAIDSGSVLYAASIADIVSGNNAEDDNSTRKKTVQDNIKAFEELSKSLSVSPIPAIKTWRCASAMFMRQESEPDIEPLFKSIEERRKELESSTSMTVLKKRPMSELVSDPSDGSSICSSESETHISNTGSPLHSSSLHQIKEELKGSISLSRKSSSTDNDDLMPVMMKSIKDRFRELQNSMAKPIPKRNPKEEIEAERLAASVDNESSQNDNNYMVHQVQCTDSTTSCTPCSSDAHKLDSIDSSTSFVSCQADTYQVDTVDSNLSFVSCSSEVPDAVSSLNNCFDSMIPHPNIDDSESDSGNNSEYETPHGSLENFSDILSTLDQLDDLPVDYEDSIEDESTLEADITDELSKTPSPDLFFSSVAGNTVKTEYGDENSVAPEKLHIS
uniref:Dentin sialophosphoprotein-like n=1 Tax=Saccoglossus kowalevskii TaxID=10224 RepID=A0ABM0LX17_SACKO|nr:PREDICTED: dentin sialophosphoprotein-like [Saccoglossus kowalevskii]